MAASPDEMALEEQPATTGEESISPVSSPSPKKEGADDNTATPSKKSKKTADNKNLINCVVFLPDGTTVSLDVDVSAVQYNAKLRHLPTSFCPLPSGIYALFLSLSLTAQGESI